MLRAVVIAAALAVAAPAHAERWSRFLFDVSAGSLGYAAVVDHGYGNGDWTYDSVGHSAAVGFRADLGFALTPRIGLVAHGSTILLVNQASLDGRVDYFASFDPVVLRITGHSRRPGHVIGHIGAGVGFLSPLNAARSNELIVGFHLMGMLTVNLYHGLGITLAFDFGALPANNTIAETPHSLFYPIITTVGLSYHID
jgi:hypothetical protein